MTETVFQTGVLIYAGKVIGFIGIGGFLDKIVALPWRERLSKFIYGTKGTSLRDFEVTLITALIELFCCRSDASRISFKRVALYTGVTAFPASTWAYVYVFHEYTENKDIALILVFFTFYLIIAYVCDIWSVYITKLIFYFKPGRLLLLPLRIALDCALTLSLPIGIIWIFLGLFVKSGDLGSTLNMLVYSSALIASLYGAIGLTAIQLISLLGGVVLRGVTKLMASPTDDESVTALRKAPFSAIFATVASIGVIVDLFVF